MAKLFRKICVWWFKKSGWTFSGELADFQPKAVFCVGPQVHFKEFIVCIAVLTITGVRATLLVNKFNFNIATERLLRGLSCRPFNTNESNIEFEELHIYMKERRKCKVAFAWQHIRNSKNQVPAFYHLVQSNQLPIVLVTINRKAKHLKIHSEFMPSGSVLRDIGFCEKVFATKG